MTAETVRVFKSFLADSNADEMFIKGPAGSGKTTNLAKLTKECISQDLEFTVLAFTHKACGVLRACLPTGTPVQTVHKYLKKRPTVNQDATKHKHITTNAKFGESDMLSVIFVDEYSQIGEKDLMDFRELQDEENEKQVKIVWIGDPEHQLPPVGDVFTLREHGKYIVKLTTVYRQSKHSPLMQPLNELIRILDGESEPHTLSENEKFVRNQDIVEWYNNDRMSPTFDGVMLAFTNRRVQELNQLAEGKYEPEPGDKLFSPTTKCFYTFQSWEPSPVCIDLPFGAPLLLGSKYKTLEYLINNNYLFANVIDEEGEECIFACMFGHYEYKSTEEHLKKEAALANKNISKKLADGQSIKAWSMANQNTEQARDRAKAWRAFLAFNECVVCLDFAHAMTVHKSQGSTYNSVYLDTQDINLAADINYTNYLKLMYVGMSRAKDYVITN